MTQGRKQGPGSSRDAGGSGRPVWRIGSLFAAVLCFTAVTLFAGQCKPFTNDDVIGMVRAGLTQETILEAIRTNEPGYDTSAEALMALKSAGVSEKIIMAILAAARVQRGPSALSSESDALSARAGALTIQSHGAKGTASAGNSMINEYNSAEIIILALDSATGAGISSLAPRGHTGGKVIRKSDELGHAPEVPAEQEQEEEGSLMPLPAGWTLETKLVPAGGCTLQPTHIYNDGQGGYTLSVMTASKRGACRWKRGEYHYLLKVNANGWQGGSIGKIVID